jgi:hypothetical protein
MKIKVYHIILFFKVLFAAPAIAQVNRSVAPGQYRQPKSNGGKFDFVAETVKYYKKELALDDFQAAAIKEIITAEKDNITNIQQQTDMTGNEKKDKAKEINDRIDAKMLPMLSPEQLKKYEKLKEKRKG